jgi:hypothetical protein
MVATTSACDTGLRVMNLRYGKCVRLKLYFFAININSTAISRVSDSSDILFGVMEFPEFFCQKDLANGATAAPRYVCEAVMMRRRHLQKRMKSRENLTCKN